jgi:hypothetical protein
MTGVPDKAVESVRSDWGAIFGHRGEPGHTRDTGHGTNTGHTVSQTSQPSQPTNAPARPRDDRIRGRLNGRSPGADRIYVGRFQGVTGGFLYKLGVVSYTIRILHVSCMYLACILHVFRCVPFIDIKIHQDTSRYIKIHLYLSLWL